ncbi:alpha/beta fold hydrolase [Roseivirga pacifica]|uniref:alpha/beta fold hydrolase n=1 Tax=Roseivirga pacifica TaxID=1267423 RepID=UPI00209593DE|nr:alpha/beta hydrolase [Roseivirga pacifica]MCO6357222.1 alpha/beta fold hydrolase [Roseivirga pacifica]MCO6368064.1 alpha/beta fold hydrolase [Roseivirga pacifica]MCO6369454.1 alpha/beta fold hydrolase [Roseivirga pacifica]MCO6373308.1 alpha/beta fold hydrolase [Roseivirga pacifica]MCO6377435.1 alpha/beta fold hydrolase [Roseivirga pacifica]
MVKKQKVRKGLKLGCFGAILFIVVTSQIASSCISFSMTDKEVSEYFESHNIAPKSVFYSVNDYEMHYMYADNGREASVVFVHGTPGSWDAFINYFSDSTLMVNFNIASPDRPGFGKSSYAKPIRSLQEQAALMKPMIEALPEPRILVGHSLGGPIIARMAMDYPELIDGLVFLAPALDPALEPDEDWFRVPMRWPVIGAIAPKIFRISNEELIFLDEELEEMLPLWEGVTAPSIIVQGSADKLVHPGNGAFADSVLVNAPHELVMLEGQNHFLPWNEHGLVVKSVMGLLKYLNEETN